MTPLVEKKKTFPRILFILKLRHTSCGTSQHEIKSSGLLNSATFVKDMLVDNGYEAKLVQVVDNNSIDREVTVYKPDVVIIEALWVVPEKFEVLRKRHPNVEWVIRIHSEVPFLSNEGIAMDWINKYICQPNVFISLNSYKTYSDFVEYFNTVDTCGILTKKILFMPNYYPVKKRTKRPPIKFVPGGTLNIGCFGAVRPMKNHLVQAFAAVKFAEARSMKCRFHINAGRVERGDEVLKNLRNFFVAFNGKHELVEHDWLDREEFLTLIRTMDFGLQVSLSETFNIVAADFVSEGIPIVGSSEIDWLPSFYCAQPTSVEDIIKTIERVVWYEKYFGWMDTARKALKKYSKLSEKIWLDNL